MYKKKINNHAVIEICNNSFMSENEIRAIGFKSFGKNLFLSKKASFYSPENISIGDNVRIDDFCLLSGEIKIGSYTHIGAYTCLMGQKGIELHDFCQMSMRVLVLSATDDFSGEFLVGPMIPEKYRKVTGGKVLFEKHSLIGCGSIIFPNLTIREGTAVGAISFVARSTKEWTVYWGIPAKPIKIRKRDILLLEKEYIEKDERQC